MMTPRTALLAPISVFIIFTTYQFYNYLPKEYLISSFTGEHGVFPYANSSETSLTRTGSQKPESQDTVLPIDSTLPPHVQQYFDQVFSLSTPPQYSFSAISNHCSRAIWPEDSVYLDCGGILAGLTSIVSQVKVCLKMALETNTGLILPSMPLRSATDLLDFNFLNKDAYMTYDQWFDASHLISSLSLSCPKLKILHPLQVSKGGDTKVKNRWTVDIGTIPGYVPFQGYFWAGRPFKDFFDGRLRELEQSSFLEHQKDEGDTGITIIDVNSQFLLFRIMDDPTGIDLALWNDLGHLVRFNEEPRKIVNSLLRRMTRPFYGVHFRVENDTIWSSFENQLTVDLDALDQAWSKYGSPVGEKPLVYLACGDQEQVQRFAQAGKLRGWEVTHKWDLASRMPADTETLKMINELPFDFQGAVDLGVMVRSEFFIGLTGSAFSSTVANARDPTGRYRGSSFVVWDDDGARTHLFNDGDASAYPCCL